MQIVAQFLAHLASVLGDISSGPYAIVVAFVLEAVMKLWPTANPQGLLLIADKFLKKVGAVVVQIGGLIAQAGDVVAKLDGLIVAVIPQNIVPPQNPQAK